jgi:hypothetical protein
MTTKDEMEWEKLHQQLSEISVRQEAIKRLAKHKEKVAKKKRKVIRSFYVRPNQTPQH